ncbi:6-phospho-3-hexuloisomerase [Bacillus taeanensis]|uniref:6-phospho-3-hexuloisomerase n=1 Tax=Bacillus taeanensis TaxID=273032 RepID=A0A366XUL9_9BACI|nr:6-phospho-3-hexuloisomerase [Bacillus taeanensis]RBW68469.1 6-phospho-3-hexuloisomerase [Bacillus taeanensis]
MSEIRTILAEIESVMKKVNESQIEAVTSAFQSNKRIFVVGEGRSGLMAKSFAMRLMHLSANVYVVGETITPSIAEDDLLIAVSGSGTTKNVVWVAEKAKELNCFVIGVTTNPESPLAHAASSILHVPAATKYRRDGELKSIQPLGSLFDQCVHILFDTICLRYAALKEVDNNQAFSKHSNLE